MIFFEDSLSEIAKCVFKFKSQNDIFIKFEDDKAIPTPLWLILELLILIFSEETIKIPPIFTQLSLILQLNKSILIELLIKQDMPLEKKWQLDINPSKWLSRFIPMEFWKNEQYSIVL